ncbi:pq loop repeat family protein [Anaeramoeba ignava]|uniref:Pq loop repeat family protein n=1 Tax=Anaeramoeba ignava TaxID=1746090 RepID=A0A9Q0RJ43_ANAIG|nr:pq loop repeat family protein [Anaeramoeba ignava]
MGSCSKFEFSLEGLACFSGLIASILFAFQYLPQTFLNYKNKSVKGFSTTGIIIKLIGSSFLLINSFLNEEAYPVVLYGLFNVIQHSTFMVQFSIYENKKEYLIWILFPIIPLSLGTIYPSSKSITNMIKPLSQVLSHFPQLLLSYKLKNTYGASIMSQHLNFFGGILGMFMVLIIPPSSNATYFVYFNSLFQSISFYSLAIYFNQWRFFDTENQEGILPRFLK